MEFFTKEVILSVFEIFLIIIITKTIIFAVYSYIASGDPLLDIVNFYKINYHWVVK